jgi:hypothetical protein
LTLWLGPLAGPYAAAAMAARPAMAKDVALATAHRAGLDLLVRVVVLGAAAGLLWLRRAPRRWGRLSAAALPMVLAFDLGSLMLPILSRSTGPRDVLYATPMPELARMGAADPHARVLSARPPAANAPGRAGLEPQAEFFINDWIRWRARALGGGHSAAPAVWRAAPDLLSSYPALCALGVVYMSTAPGAAPDSTLFRKVRETGDEAVYRLTGALSRLYAVPRVVSAGNDVATVGHMASASFAPHEVALAADPGAAGDYPGSSRCALRWVEDEPDRVAFDVEAEDRAFVVLADTYFPGWEARVDDRPAPLLRVNQVARGVAVPAGRHRVTMRYAPEGWAGTVPVTRAAMVLWIAGAVTLGAWRTRRKFLGL